MCILCIILLNFYDHKVGNFHRSRKILNWLFFLAKCLHRHNCPNVHCCIVSDISAPTCPVFPPGGDQYHCSDRLRRNGFIRAWGRHRRRPARTLASQDQDTGRQHSQTQSRGIVSGLFSQTRQIKLISRFSGVNFPKTKKLLFDFCEDYWPLSCLEMCPGVTDCRMGFYGCFGLLSFVGVKLGPNVEIIFSKNDIWCKCNAIELANCLYF